MTSIQLQLGTDALLRVNTIVNAATIQANDEFKTVQESVREAITQIEKTETQSCFNLKARVVALSVLKRTWPMVALFYISPSISNKLNVFNFTANKIGLPEDFSLFKNDGSPLIKKLLPWAVFWIASAIIDGVIEIFFISITEQELKSYLKDPLIKGIHKIQVLKNGQENAWHHRITMVNLSQRIATFATNEGAPTQSELKPALDSLIAAEKKFEAIFDHYEVEIREIAKEQNLFEYKSAEDGQEIKVGLENAWLLNPFFRIITAA